MQFFVREILARAVAAWLCYDSLRAMGRGLADRQIASYSTDLVVWLLSQSSWITRRDAQPVLYWMQIAGRGFGAAACLFVVVFGWPQQGGRAPAGSEAAAPSR